jgi:nucleotide-binding universal stress UspA family protein
MTIKRILLPLCDNGDLEPIAKAAFQLGQLLSAQVRGLLVLAPYFLPTSGEAVPPEMVQLVVDHDRRIRAEKFKQAHTVFEGVQTCFPHVEGEFAAATGDLRDIVSHAARLADISVLGSGSQFAANGWDEVREAALFGSGRPVLLVPATGIPEGSFDRVMIAWKESIEAARAIAAADPFLMFAKEVELITIGENAAASLQEIEKYLQLHYSELRSEIVAPSEKRVGEILMEKCAAQGPTLLVMGAYSHWRWQERVFGGVTEHVLRNARMPVLMSH